MHRLGIVSRICLIFMGTLLPVPRAVALCGTAVVIVRGRITHPPPSAIVRIQLLYAKSRRGESGEVTTDNGKFSIQIPFLKQSRAPKLFGNFLEKCDSRPQTVVVTLFGGSKSSEYDRVSLNLKKDFEMADTSAFGVRSEVILSGAK